MMLAVYEFITLAAAVGSGLIAGLCFAFASFIMRALDTLGPAQAIRAMQAINSGILQSGAMVVWLGTAVAGVASASLAIVMGQGSLAIVAAVLYLLGAMVITRGGNIPLNEALDRVEPDSPGAGEEWQRYHASWGRWNGVRTAVCALASAGFMMAL